MKLTKNERNMIILTLILLIAIIIKSFVFDPFKPSNEAEQAFSDFAYSAADKQFDHQVYDYGIVQLKLVDVKIEDGKYKGKMRKYVLGFVPYADVIVKEGEGVED